MKYLFYFLIFSTNICFGQQFARPGHPLSNLLEMNPAFAGGTLKPRIQASYRNLSPKLSSNYVNNYFAADLNMASMHSGAGVFFSTQNISQSILKTNKLGLVYNYHMALSDEWNCRLGLGGYFQSQKINSNNLIFPDQISPLTGEIGSTNEPLLQRAVRNVNFSSGFLFYRSDFWIGGGVSEIVRNRNFFTSGASSQHFLNLSFHTLKRFVIDQSFDRDELPGQFVDAVLVYERSGPFQQLSAGGSFTYKPISLGMFYKGFPFQKNKAGSLRNEAMVFKFEFKESDLSFFYNFELPFQIQSSGNGHQIGIAFNFPELEAFQGKRRWKKETEVVF